jgi:hypothetical protein
MMGGRAGYLLFAMIAYTPAGQGRIEAPHFLLAISTAALILWPKRYQIILHRASTQPHTPAQAPQSRPTD